MRSRTIQTIALVAAALLLSALPLRSAQAFDSTTLPSQVHKNMQELWKASVSSVDHQEDPSIRKAVGEVRSIDLTKKPQAKKAEEPTTRPVQEAAAQPVVAGPKTMSPAMLESLKKQVAGNPKDSLVIADSLFEGGHVDQAEAVYQELLAVGPQDDGKDWVLLQLGHCRRTRDAAAARAVYSQFLAEHPKSQWAGVAEQEIKLIDWTSVNAPQAVIDAAEARTATSQPSSMPVSSAPSSRAATEQPASMPAAGGAPASSPAGGGR
jgi:hypothetical protein